MLLFDRHKIGDKLFSYRKRLGLTQAEVAEAAELSDRTYADIERGNVNMRTETLLAICKVLRITPNEVLTDSTVSELENREAELFSLLKKCSIPEREAALNILEAYLSSLNI